MKKLTRSFASLTAMAMAMALTAPALAQSPEEQLAAASALFDVGKYAEAAQRLDAFLNGSPPKDKVGVAALTLGRCYTELSQFPKAIPAYERAIASRDAQVVSIAQLGLSEAAMQTSQWEKAARALDAVVKQPLKADQAPIVWYWRAQANFQLQRFPEAEQSYLKVAQDYPRSEFVDSAYFGAGVAALRAGKKDAARERLKVVVDRYPKSEDRPQAILLMANLDLEAKRYPEARRGYELLLAHQSAAKDPAVGRAAEEGLIRSLLEQQDYAAAAPRLQAFAAKLPASDPQRPTVQLTLGNCLYRQKQFDGALAAYREAAKSTDASVAAEGTYWAANAALSMNRHPEAAALFAGLVDRFPKHALAPKAQLKAGDALAAAKQMDQAAAAYQEVRERFPQSPEAAEATKALGDLALTISDPVQLASILKSVPAEDRLKGTLRLARLHLQAKKYPQAEATLTELVRANPQPKLAAEAKYLLGLTHDAQKKPAPAAAALADAVSADPTAAWAADAQSRLAWLYIETKRPADAEKAAMAVLAAKPKRDQERDARLALVQAQLDQQKWDAALEGCRALMANDPPAESLPLLVYTQAWVNEKLQKPAEALPMWERLLADHRKTDYAAEALVRVADARFKAQKYAEARPLFAAVPVEFPKSALLHEARFKLGSTLFHLEKYAEATVEWDRLAADKTAGDWTPEALYWAGVSLDKAGKKVESLDRLERLSTQYPKHPRVPTAKIRLAALKAVLGK